METSIISLALCTAGLIYSVYTDLKYRTINNKLIAVLIVIGLILNRFEALKNLLLVFLLTFLLWNLGVLSAGDSKVFLFISALIPNVNKEFLYSFPVAVITNSILLSFPIFLVYGLLKASKIINRQMLLGESKLKIISTAKATLIVAVSYLLSKYLYLDILIAILLFTVITILLEKKYRKIYIVYVPAIIFVELKMLIVVFSVILLINTILLLLKFASMGLKKEKKIDELKEGEILAGAVYDDGKFVESIKERIKIKKKPIIIPMARGLNKEEIRILKKLKKEGKIYKIKIRESVPFVPSIFAGFIVSYFIGDLILISIRLLKSTIGA